MIINGYRITLSIFRSAWALLVYSLALNLAIVIVFTPNSPALFFQAKLSIVCIVADIIILLVILGEKLNKNLKWQKVVSSIKILLWVFVVVMAILRIVSLITDRSGRIPGEDLLDLLLDDRDTGEPDIIPSGYVVLIVFAMVCDCALLFIWWGDLLLTPYGVFSVCSVSNILVSIAIFQINLDLINIHFVSDVKRIHNLYAYNSCSVIVLSTVGLFIILLINEKNRLSELIGKFVMFYDALLLLIALFSFACFLITFYALKHQNVGGDFPVSLPILFGVSLLLDIALYITSRYFRMRRQPTTLSVEEYDLNGLSDFHKSGWAKLINLNHRYNSGVNGEAIISLMSAYSSSRLEGMECKVLRVYNDTSNNVHTTQEKDKNQDKTEKNGWLEKVYTKFQHKKGNPEAADDIPKDKGTISGAENQQITTSEKVVATGVNSSPGKNGKQHGKKVNDNIDKEKHASNSKEDNSDPNPFKTNISNRKKKDAKKSKDNFIDLEIQTSKHLDKVWDYLDKDSVLFEKGNFTQYDANSLDEFKPLSKNQAKKLAKKQKDSKLQNQIEEIQAESKRFYNELMETEALVLLTVITEFDLTERIPGTVGKNLHKWFGKGSRYPILCIKFGLLGFHWPFKRSTFYCSSTKKPVARSASIMYSIAKWNKNNEKCTILLDPTYKHDYSETGIKFSGWIKVALPNSHIIDLRPYKNSSLTQYFKGVKYRSQANTFAQANGEVVETFDFTTENCQIIVDMNKKIAESRTEGNQSDTLLHPTAQFIQGVGTHYNENKYRSLLYLKVDDEIIASCVIFRLGDTITSDIQGLNHDVSKKYKAYFVMMQEVIRIALEEKVSFVDFGPTTETAKVSIGCEVVPLVGSLYPRNKLLGPVIKIAASKVDV